MLNIRKFYCLWILSVLMGPVLQFNGLYLFHFIFVLLVSYLIVNGQLSISKPFLNFILAFTAFLILSFAWAPSWTNWLRSSALYFQAAFAAYTSYRLCVSSIKIAGPSVEQAALNVLNPVRLVTILNAACACWNILFFDLPIPYSDLGFNGNENNFYFVFVILLPILFVGAGLGLRLILLLMALLFLGEGSRGYFAGLCTLGACYIFVAAGRYRKFVLPTTVLLLMFTMSSLDDFFRSYRETLRIFSVIDSYDVAIEYFFEKKPITVTDSTTLRAHMYLYGLDKWSEHFILGLGPGGISSLLLESSYFSQFEKPRVAFHFFFLEVLIDVGILVFLILSISFFRILQRLFRMYKSNPKDMDGKVALALFVSLVASIPASISPSSIIFNLSFWFLLGLSFAWVKLDRNISREQ